MTAHQLEDRREAACESVIAFHQGLHDPAQPQRMEALAMYIAGVLWAAVDDDDSQCAATARGIADGLRAVVAEEDRRAES